tara:strand:- start:52 stop:255 length:204 start_codon:yes stop_codon:yes gene_type:complete
LFHEKTTKSKTPYFTAVKDCNQKARKCIGENGIHPEYMSKIEIFSVVFYINPIDEKSEKQAGNPSHH